MNSLLLVMLKVVFSGCSNKRKKVNGLVVFFSGFFDGARLHFPHLEDCEILMW